MKVWVLRRLIGSAATVTVPPAVASDLVGPGDEIQADDAYLMTGAGSPINDAEAAFFATLDDQPPEARVLRLAG